jgi:dihydroneopterin aldolase
VDCIVGVHPHERDVLQPLCIDADLALDTEPAAVSERIGQTVDYDFASSQIVFLLKSCRFGLLETAAHALARHLLAAPAEGERRARLASVRLRLSKPAALRAGTVASVEIERHAEWASLPREIKPFGTVDVVFETKEAGIYRLNIAPGRQIPMHVHRHMQEAEMVLGEGLWCQGKPVPAGAVFRWPADAPHTYQNPTDRYQTILCVDRPAFVESDEVPVEADAAEVAHTTVYDL